MSFEGLRREMSDLFGTQMSDTDGFRGLGMLYDGKETPRRADASREQNA
jgi:hypothetical protein